MTHSGLTDKQKDALIYALDRLALGFESADPRIRHEAKWVAKNNISRLANETSQLKVP